MSLTIYHNPRCSKSRQTLELLRSRGLDPQVVEYLKTPPDAALLTDILAALDAEPAAIMRTGEDDYKAERDSVAAMDRPAQIRWLADHIRVMQRPIVVNGDKARIGRPPEAVIDILD